MNCNNVKKSLSDYSVGLIHGRELSEIQAHIETCASCKAELEKIERIVLMVEGLDIQKPPVGLWNGVYNRIASDQRVTKKSSVWATIRSTFRHSAARWSVGLATAALAGLLAFARIDAPVAPGHLADGEYVQGHVMYASQEFLADDAALQSVAALADREQYGIEQL